MNLKMQHWNTSMLFCYILILLGCFAKHAIAQDGIGHSLPNDAKESLQRHRPQHLQRQADVLSSDSSLVKELPAFLINTTGLLSLHSPSFQPKSSHHVLSEKPRMHSQHGGRFPSLSHVASQNRMSNLPHLYNINQQHPETASLPRLHPVITNDRPMSRKPSLEFPLKTQPIGETNRDFNVNSQMRFPDDAKSIYVDVNADDMQSDYGLDYPEEYENNDSFQPQLENIAIEADEPKSTANNGNGQLLGTNGSSIENMIHFNMNMLLNETSEHGIVDTRVKHGENSETTSDTNVGEGEGTHTPLSVDNALEPAGQPTSEILISVTPPTEVIRSESEHDDYYADYNDTLVDENLPVVENETGVAHGQNSNYEYYDVRNADDTGTQNDGVLYADENSEGVVSEDDSNHHAEHVVPEDIADEAPPEDNLEEVLHEDAEHEAHPQDVAEHNEKDILEDTAQDVATENIPEDNVGELAVLGEVDEPEHASHGEQDLHDTKTAEKDLHEVVPGEKEETHEEVSSVFPEDTKEVIEEVSTAEKEMPGLSDESELPKEVIEAPIGEIDMPADKISVPAEETAGETDSVKAASEVGSKSSAVSYADSDGEHSYFSSDNQDNQNGGLVTGQIEEVNKEHTDDSLNSEHITSTTSTTTTTTKPTTAPHGYAHSPRTVSTKPQVKKLTTTTTTTTEQASTESESETTSSEPDTTTTDIVDVKVAVIDKNYNATSTDETSSFSQSEVPSSVIDPIISDVANHEHSDVPSNRTDNTDVVVIVEPLFDPDNDGTDHHHLSNKTEMSLINEHGHEDANSTMTLPSADVETSTATPSTDFKTSTMSNKDIIETFHLLNKTTSSDETKNDSASVDYFAKKEPSTISTSSITDVTETTSPSGKEQNKINSTTESSTAIIHPHRFIPNAVRRVKINISTVPTESIEEAILPPGFSTEEPVSVVLLPLKSRNISRGRKIASLFDQLLEKQKVNETEIPIVTDIPIKLKDLSTGNLPLNVNTTGNNTSSFSNATSNVDVTSDSENTTAKAVASTTESAMKGRRVFPSLSRKPFPFTRSGPAVTRAPFKIATRKTSDILKAKRPTLRPPGSHLTAIGSGHEYPSDPDARAEAATEMVPETTTTQRIVTTLSPYFLWGQSIEVACTFKIQSGVEWIQELEDHSSTDYNELAKKIHKEINSLYQRSQLNDRFKGIQIEGFSKGSVIVDYTLYLTETDEFVDASLLWETISKSLENGTNIGDYVVDPGSLSFEVIRKITPPPEVSANDDLLIPHWAIAVIVIAAASLTFLIILCLAVNRNRRGAKRKYGNPLKEDSVVERAKTWDKSVYDNLGAGSLYDINDTWDEKKLKQQQQQRNYGQYEYGGSHSSSVLYGMKQKPENGNLEDPYSHGQYYDSWRSDWSRSARGSSKPPDYDTTF